MWKAPNRPNNQITQDYNDGIVTVYRVENVSQPGCRPVEGLIKKVAMRYAEQRLGINRYYAGRQNQIEIEKVVRVQRAGGINNQDVAIIDDKQYRVDWVQSVPDVYPPSLDLTLVKIEQKYEVTK